MGISGNSVIKSWLEAMRFRTLPLSISNVALGGALAFTQGAFSVSIFLLSLLAAVFLQILSNFANDYGDASRGSDGPGRAGPSRAVASGKISRHAMLGGIIVMCILCALSCLGLILLAFSEHWQMALLFAFLGAACIVAAVCYTMGRHPYGYYALGDIFVFIFFGPVSVWGGYLLYMPEAVYYPVLPACAAGLFSTAVLNVNNIRDIENDKANKKITLPVLMGERTAKRYQLGLIFGGFLCWVIWIGLYAQWWQLFFLLGGVPLIKSGLTAWRTKSASVLDGQLKATSISTGLLNLVMILLFFITK